MKTLTVYLLLFLFILEINGQQFEIAGQMNNSRSTFNSAKKAGNVYDAVDTKKIIADKKLDVEHTLQLFRLRRINGVRKPSIFSIAHLNNVLKDGWHTREFANHFQNMSYKELKQNQDSLKYPLQ